MFYPARRRATQPSLAEPVVALARMRRGTTVSPMLTTGATNTNPHASRRRAAGCGAARAVGRDDRYSWPAVLSRYR